MICDDSRKLFDLKKHFEVFQLWLTFFFLFLLQVASTDGHGWGGDVAVRGQSHSSAYGRQSDLGVWHRFH